MGFNIGLEFLRPLRVEFWKGSDFSQFSPQAPFRYQADALLGLSVLLLHPTWKGPHLPASNSQLPLELWRQLEPHAELYNRAHARVQALRSKKASAPSIPFETGFQANLKSACANWGLDLMDLHELANLINHIEEETDRPLLYNFDFQVTESCLQQLLFLHSLLFNLRTLVAMDYNAYIQEPTHEALHVDSISDYLPRAEYVVNDALLYLQFTKQVEKMQKSAAQSLEQAFLNYSHNGTCLVRNMPPSFLQSMKPELLEESLYLVQMDWLLGSPAGLLYRIREEVFGLIEGYNEIFWPDAQQMKTNKSKVLTVQTELTESSLNLSPAVA